ncbi:MAG: hypothetical protein OHK0052_07520 [Anaerolineales bacterium]
MSETPSTLYKLSPDEEILHYMVYTADNLFMGDLISKKTIRISTFVRTPMAPKYLVLYDAKVLSLDAKPGTRPAAFPLIHVPLASVLAMHPRPPAAEPIDYDQSEANRKFEQASLLVGPLRFDGKFRMSIRTNVTQYLDVTKEPFISLYEATITSMVHQEMGIIQSAMITVRREGVPIAAYSTTAESGVQFSKV